MLVTVDEDGETRVRDIPRHGTCVGPRPAHRDRAWRYGGTRQDCPRTHRACRISASIRVRSELQAAVEAATAAVGQARAERQRAATALDRARSTLRRQQELMKAGAIAADALEAAETALATAEDGLRRPSSPSGAPNTSCSSRARACQPRVARDDRSTSLPQSTVPS